jgi:RHS repeat-associated protein
MIIDPVALAYDFGARMYDARLGRWLSIDKLFKEASHVSPYNFVSNSPIRFIDIEGHFKLNYTEAQLKEIGLTKLDMVRFEQIVNNIGKLIIDNPEALEEISKTTGFTKERILKDMKRGEGLNIILGGDDFALDGSTNNGSVTFNSNFIKELANTKDQGCLAEQTLGIAMALFHEYGHYGDQETNKGKNSGQYIKNGITKVKTFYADIPGFNSIKEGLGLLQRKITFSGHRGDDLTLKAFGLRVQKEGKILKTHGDREDIPAHITFGTLREKAAGLNILNTLEVK